MTCAPFIARRASKSAGRRGLRALAGAQVGVEGYTEWIQLVADLTVSSLGSWQWAAGSVYYLLGLWSRLVSSMPYLKGDSPSLLDTYVPRINQAYITSRRAALSPRTGPPAIADAALLAEKTAPGEPVCAPSGACASLSRGRTCRVRPAVS